MTNFWSKNILGQRNFGSEKIVSLKFFWSNKILELTKLWIQKNFGPQKSFESENNVCPKKDVGAKKIWSTNNWVS